MRSLLTAGLVAGLLSGLIAVPTGPVLAQAPARPQAAPARPAAAPSTLAAVRARGMLVCGVNPGLPGFALADGMGTVRGLDADTCRAVAAAIFGDPSKVRFVPGGVTETTAALTAGRIDMAARNLTQTMARDTDLGLSAAGVNFFDGQGFLAPVAARITDAQGLNGKRVCVVAGTSTEQGLADAARRYGITMTVTTLPDFAQTRDAYVAGRCDVVSSDISQLTVMRQTGLTNPAEHAVLPAIISREPLGPLVRDGDAQWRSLVFWVVNGMLDAEARGITSANALAMRADPSAVIRRFLGSEPGLGAPLGLSDDWLFNVVTKVGNYGEVFDRNLGAGSSLKMERGLNALWNRGGLMYPLPMR